ncbi:related to probable gtp-binding protein engb [Rhynchosporium secalis]|uniref:GTP-binding protein 8 n=1 Tax=Rhynchosporium secalis TaxID=38038 RepID=A0A1E1LUL8_RHYSE|nr:related to probable gtp-binding protein engb [Rhynchosporium secalis]
MSVSTKLLPCLRCQRLQTLPIRNFSTTTVPLRKPNPNLQTALSYHWDTLPPTPQQLTHSAQFFERRPPEFLWSAEKFKRMDFSTNPEICVLGRSNVGKSSLLNALLNKKVAHTSAQPGRTRLMNAFGVGGLDRGNPLVVLDMPGYGYGAAAEWGLQIMKYLEKRKELKRVFLLVDAEHGVKETDIQILNLFKSQGIPYQVILSKVDKVLYGKGKPGKVIRPENIVELRRKMEEVKDAIQPDTEDDGAVVGEVLACSSQVSVGGKRMGVNAVRHAMLQAVGLEMKPAVKLAEVQEIVSFEEIYGREHEHVSEPKVVSK